MFQEVLNLEGEVTSKERSSIFIFNSFINKHAGCKNRKRVGLISGTMKNNVDRAFVVEELGDHKDFK